jgi:hypothetical protein
MTLNKTIRLAFLLLAPLSLIASGVAADASKAIILATTDYVKKMSAITDPLVTVEKVVDGYARVQVKSQANATDPATAFLKMEKGKWRVLTLGTAFGPDDYQQFKIPAALQQ